MGIFRYYKILIFITLYRSEDVDLYQVSLTKDAAWNIMNELGEAGNITLIDLNKSE